MWDSKGLRQSQCTLGCLRQVLEATPYLSSRLSRSGPATAQVEYFRNEKGEVMKKTTKTRVVKIEKKVYKVRPAPGAGQQQLGPCSVAGLAQRNPGARWELACARLRCHVQAQPLHVFTALPPPQVAQERRASWRKFGEAATERATDSVTSQTPDEVQLERIQRQKQTQVDSRRAAAAVWRGRRGRRPGRRVLLRCGGA